jgi:deoxycytidylate deaminase
METASRLLAKHPDVDVKHKLVCLALKGWRISNYGFNSIKTHPAPFRAIVEENIQERYEGQAQRPYMKPCIHAEWAAVKGSRSVVDRVLVYREKADGSAAMARPCNVCMALLRRSGVKEVMYSDGDGNLQREKI